jgi:Phosphotransferase enzyme family
VKQLRRTPPAATAGVWYVTAGSDSAVLKVVHDGGSGSPRWPASSDPADPYYWRREPCAYESGLLDPFGAPDCRALVKRDDGSVALWLEAAPEVADWTPEVLAGVARRLGRAQAAPAPDEPWLSRGWLRAYLALRDVAGTAVLDRLDALPQTLCHHDFHPANVLGARADVVIDWAYCGLGAIGLDPGVLVADGIADEAFPAELADAACSAVWDGYLAGLRDGGWSGDESDVRVAFVHGTTLRLSWLPRGERPAWDATTDFLQRLASTTE